MGERSPPRVDPAQRPAGRTAEPDRWRESLETIMVVDARSGNAEPEQPAREAPAGSPFPPHGLTWA